MRLQEPVPLLKTFPPDDPRLTNMLDKAGRMGKLLPECRNIGKLLIQMNKAGFLLLQDQESVNAALTRALDQLSRELESEANRRKEADKQRRKRRKSAKLESETQIDAIIEAMNIEQKIGTGPQFAVRITNCQILQLLFYEECEAIEVSDENNLAESSSVWQSDLCDEIVMFRYLKFLVTRYIEKYKVQMRKAVVGQLNFVYHAKNKVDGWWHYSAILDISGVSCHRGSPLSQEEAKSETGEHSDRLIKQLRKRFTCRTAAGHEHCLLRIDADGRNSAIHGKRKSGGEIVGRDDSSNWMDFVRTALDILNFHLDEEIPGKREAVQLTRHWSNKERELSDEIKHKPSDKERELSDEIKHRLLDKKTECNGRFLLFSLLSQEKFEKWWCAKEDLLGEAEARLGWEGYKMNYWKNLADHLRLPKFSFPFPSHTPPAKPPPHTPPAKPSHNLLQSTAADDPVAAPALLSKGQGPDPDFFRIPDWTGDNIRKIDGDLERLSRQRKKAGARELIVMRNGREYDRIPLDRERTNSKIVPVSDGDLLQLRSEEEGMIIPLGRYKFSHDDMVDIPVISRFEGGQRVSFVVRLPQNEEYDTAAEAEVEITYHFPLPGRLAALKAWWTDWTQGIHFPNPKLVGVGALVFALLFLAWKFFRKPESPPIVKTLSQDPSPQISPAPSPTSDFVQQQKRNENRKPQVIQSPQKNSGLSPTIVEELVINDGGKTLKVRKDGRPPIEIALLGEHEKLFGAMVWDKRLPDPVVKIPKRDTPGVVAGIGGNDMMPKIELLKPKYTLVRDVRPEFVWKPLPGIKKYTVSITDDGGNRYGEGKVIGNRWKADNDIPRGKPLLWMVNAVETAKNNKPYSFSVPFRVLSDDELKKLEEYEDHYRSSRIMRAVLHIQYGLLDEAALDLKKLERDNQRSSFEPVVRALKEELEKLRKRLHRGNNN